MFVFLFRKVSALGVDAKHFSVVFFFGGGKEGEGLFLFMTTSLSF